MKSIILLLVPFTALAKPPIHCAPNPYAGTYYVDGVKYDQPKPKKCYSVMRKDGEVMDRRALVFKTDHYEEDPVLLKAAQDSDYAPDRERALKEARKKELADKKEDLSAEEMKEAIRLLLKK